MRAQVSWLGSFLVLAALASGCTVPTLSSLDPKLCDLDAGLGCVKGYQCNAGVCVAGSTTDGGGACTDGDTRPCGSSVGECSEGTQRCASGVFGACVGAIDPTPERCNGKDDDCDGPIDEDVIDVPPCEKDAGVCATATRSCVDGGFQATCSYGTSYQLLELTCDGLDNDCDGLADNGVSGGACPSQLGVCNTFNRACTAGAPGVCLAPFFEAVEATCDGRDNDCNGSVDENLTAASFCAKDAGVCAGKHPACVDGGFEASCTALSYGSSYEAVEVACDGLDNDCDGRVDRAPDGGLLTAVPKQSCELSLGVCASSSRLCVAGQGEAPCTAASYGSLYVPVDGTCDGVDNDCDGRADRSREAAVVTSAAALTGHLSWVSTPGTRSYAAAYVDARGGVEKVFFRSFDAQLKPSGSELLLSSATAVKASKPAVALLGSTVVVTWLEGTTTQTIFLAQLDPSVPSAIWRMSVVPNVTLLGDPRVAVSAGGTQIFLAWVDGATATLRGAVFNTSGGVTTAPKVLSAQLADGGGAEQVFDCDVQTTDSPNDFALAWSSFSAGVGSAAARNFTGSLNPATGVRTHGPASGETVRNVRLVRAAATIGSLGEGLGLAWVAVAATEERVRYSADVSVPSAGVVVAAASSIPDLAATAGPSGPVAVWVQGIVGARLELAPLRADAGTSELAGDAGAAYAPALASFDGGFAAGYESDRGQGLDLYGQVVCGP